MFDPYTGKFPITDDWAAHVARNTFGGGIDWAMPVGTPLIVPEFARVEFIPNNGTGGHTVKMIYERGEYDVYMHCSEFVEGAYVRGPGAVCALSGGAKGAPGAGNSTGPHLHSHGVSREGVRIPPHFFGTGSRPAGSAASPTITKRKRKDMEFKVVQLHRDDAPADSHWLAVLITPNGVVQVDNQAEPERFASLEGIFGAGMNRSEYAVKRPYLQAIPGVAAELAALRPEAGAAVPIDYDKLAAAIKESGALDLIISGTARPAATI